jgi:hypothetical protein
MLRKTHLMVAGLVGALPPHPDPAFLTVRPDTWRRDVIMNFHYPKETGLVFQNTNFQKIPDSAGRIIQIRTALSVLDCQKSSYAVAPRAELDH